MKLSTEDPIWLIQKAFKSKRQINIIIISHSHVSRCMHAKPEIEMKTNIITFPNSYSMCEFVTVIELL